MGDLSSNMKKIILYCLFSFLAGCYGKPNTHAQEEILGEITKQAPGLMSFKDVADEQWTRICFFGPYTLESKSSSVLGFDWEVTKQTEIGSNDSINVVSFATDKRITEFVVVPRSKADFWKLSGKCFSRIDANFYYDPKVWSYLHK